MLNSYHENLDLMCKNMSYGTIILIELIWVLHLPALRENVENTINGMLQYWKKIWMQVLSNFTFYLLKFSNYIPVKFLQFWIIILSVFAIMCLKNHIMRSKRWSILHVDWFLMIVTITINSFTEFFQRH